MKYQIRPGVVLSEVCGEYLLLATMEASRYCPYVYQINETAAFFCHLLKKPLTVDEIVTIAVEEYEVAPDILRNDVKQLLRNLLEKGYLLEEEEKT